MKIKFVPLLTIGVTHSYYTGRCEDFDFVTPATTAAMLRSGRLLARRVEGQLHVYVETDEAGGPIQSIAGSTLVFGLRLVNPAFTNYTAPVVQPRQLTPYYTNGVNANALDAATGLLLTSGHHVHVPQSADRPLIVSLVNLSGVTLAAEQVEAGTV